MECSNKLCIICSQETIDNDSHLVSPKTYDSWLTMLKAATIRKHNAIIDAAKQLNTGEVPETYYHRKCRSDFTLKRDLDTISKTGADKRLSLDEENVASSSKRLCRRQPESRTYDPICIFCDKVCKYTKGTKTREKLVQAVQIRADQTLRECAILKGDDKILAITSRDIVAAEAQYHISCYKRYTVKVTVKECKEKDNDDDEGTYHTIENQAFANLYKFIRTEIIPNKRIVTVTSLTAKLESFMLSGEVKFALRDSATKHIRRRLESELANSIHILQDAKGKLLLVPNSMTLQEAAIKIYVMNLRFGKKRLVITIRL